MNKIKEFYTKYKKYIAAFAVGVVAGISHIGVEIPAWVMTALRALGLAA